MVVPLNEAAVAATQYYPAVDPVQLGRLTGRLVQAYIGPQIFARLQRFVGAGPEGLTAGDKSEV
jgi:hypothetical protein